MSAYYSRNNSYSRSYNATAAEGEQRFPRTRAASFLGLSTAAFDAGCKKANYTTGEWHHVGKYANEVYYYDTTELRANPLFWLGAKTKNNANFCETKRKMALKDLWEDRMAGPNP